MEDVKKNLFETKRRIAEAAKRAGRKGGGGK